VTISAGTATFSTAITGLQAGDMIVYDPATLKKCWITAVTSTTVVTVADSLGFAVADQAAVAVQYTGRPSHFRHIFRILPTTALPSMVLEKGFTDLAQYALYTGCKVSSLGLSFGGDSELVAELSFLGADESISATKYATAPAPVAKAVYADRFQQFDATVKEGGSASNGDVIQTMKLTINRNLSGENFVINGGGIRRSLPEGKAAVGGSIAALFEDTTILTKVKGFTKSSLDITLSNTATGSALRLWEPEIKYGDSTPPINGPGGVILEADYTAFKTPSNLASSAVQAELTTKIASFA
jgi:hypothetical protein